MRWRPPVSNALRILAVSALLVAGSVAAADLPGSMSSYGLKPSSPPQSEPRASEESEYVFPDLQEPERNPWSGVPQGPYGNSGQPNDRSLNPWLDNSMPRGPEAPPPPGYAPDDHRERLQQPSWPGYADQPERGYPRPRYDRRYDYGYDYGYPGGYSGYGGVYDPSLSPYGVSPYPGYGYGLDGYPGGDGFGMPFLGTPFDWFF
jgi:hypothetical protein